MMNSETLPILTPVLLIVWLVFFRG